MEPLLKAENVTVIYNEGKSNEFTALNNISLEVFPQEYIIFFGPSGSGKSTMLYTLLGLQSPSKGAVYIKGQDSSKLSEIEKTKTTSRFFGIVFQNFNLIYSLNVFENIMLPQVFVDVSLKERREKATTLMERFGIASRARDLPNNLSGGQQQRVAISRSLINDPQILLADEPVGNLDSESAKVVMHTISEINRKDKKTIILVTHDASYLPYADRIFYFKDAKLERMEKNDHPIILADETLDLVAGGGKAPQLSPHDELERLAHIHKSLSVPELKAWLLTQYLVEEMTTEQVERLEKNMETLLGGTLTLGDFYAVLHLPFTQGGVGLYRATANKYCLKMKEILDTVADFKIASKGNHKKRLELVHLLRRFVLSEYHSDLTHSQISRLEKAIIARVNLEVTSHEFMELLRRPIIEGGAHLRESTARHLAEKLDIILAEIQKYEDS